METLIYSENSHNPVSLILNTPQALIRNIPHKRAYILGTMLNVSGLGVINLRGRGLILNASNTLKNDSGRY